MRRAFVVAPNWIGDALLAQPLFARLHELNPGLAIDVIAPPAVAPVLGRMPEVARAISVPFAHGALQLRERRRLAREVAAEGYDAAFVLPNSWKSALVPYLARIPLRIGFHGEARYLLLNRRHHLDKAKLPLMAERYAQLAEPIGSAPHRPLHRSSLRVDLANQANALSVLDLHTDRPIVVMCPGAEYGPAKRWPPRHFATLAAQFAARGRQVWLMGAPKDRDIATAIGVLAPGATVNLAGLTDLTHAIDLMALAEIVVTNDSGLMHVAAALDRPIAALYGSSSPDHTPPLSARAALARIAIECSPCYQRECPLGHFRCMNDLTPELVLAAVARIGADDPTPPRTSAQY
jgi:heptosyltransferase II